MCRNIFLSGAASLLPGLAGRLERAVAALQPGSTVIAGQHRQHAAFRGAAVVAQLGAFDRMCVWAEDWNEMGEKAIGKFRDDSTGQQGDNAGDDDDNDDYDSDVEPGPGGMASESEGNSDDPDATPWRRARRDSEEGTNNEEDA